MSTANRVALLIASMNYDDSRLREMRSPAHDVTALQEVLADPRIGDFQVELLIDRPVDLVRRRVQRFFAAEEPSDLMVLYISGHGIRDDDGRLYFAAPDTDLDELDATALSAEFVNRHLGRSSRDRVVVLLDCCYAGAFAAGLLSKADHSVRLGEAFAGQGRAVLTSSRATEYSFEGGRLTDNRPLPSVFTDVLVQGLRTGAADRDRDGWVSLDELYGYVHDGVRRLNPRQTPTRWYFGVEGDLHLARRAEPAKLRLSPSAVDFGTLPVGSESPTRIVQIHNDGSGRLDPIATTSDRWLRIHQTTDSFILSLDTSSAGARDGTVAIASTGGTGTIHVTARVEAPPRLVVAPGRLDFGSVPHGEPGPTLDVQIRNDGDGVLAAQAFTYASWLRLELFDDRLSVRLAGPPPGDYHDTIIIDSAGGRQEIPVRANVTAPTPARESTTEQDRQSWVDRIDPTILTRARENTPPGRDDYARPAPGPTPRSHPRITAAVAAVILALLASVVLLQFRTEPASHSPEASTTTPTPTPLATPTPTPTSTPTPTPIPPPYGELLLADDFSNKATGDWDEYSDQHGSNRYINRGFRLTSQPGWIYWSTPGSNNSSLGSVARVRIDSTVRNASDSGSFGAVCREGYANGKDGHYEHGYYELVANNSGLAYLSKNFGDEWTTLAVGSFTLPESPRSGHTFTAVCVGNANSVHLALWVDGQFAAEAYDRSDALPPGETGLICDTDSSSARQGEVVYDDVIISRVH